MRPRSSCFVFLFLLAATNHAAAQSALPLVDNADFAKVKANCERLLKTLDELQAQLPKETTTALRQLLLVGEKDEEAVLKIQRLLDPHCLVGVTINPESRVKAARGVASAELRRDRAVFRLAKVHNDAGVTQALALTSPQLLNSKEGKQEDHWLDASVHTKAPMTAKLGGHDLEYVILHFTTNATGKREARLAFDVGQGTQDLGFRAEVPVLFTIK